MKFISNTIKILSETSWPDSKQRWTDFLSVMEYTAFFVAVIYLFDFAVSRGILNLVKLF